MTKYTFRFSLHYSIRKKRQRFKQFRFSAHDALKLIVFGFHYIRDFPSVCNMGFLILNLFSTGFAYCRIRLLTLDTEKPAVQQVSRYTGC